MTTGIDDRFDVYLKLALEEYANPPRHTARSDTGNVSRENRCVQCAWHAHRRLRSYLQPLDYVPRWRPLKTAPSLQFQVSFVTVRQTIILMSIMIFITKILS